MQEIHHKINSIVMRKKNKKLINRKEAVLKMGKYGKYTVLTAIGTYILLNPKKAQAQSPENPGEGF